MSLLLFSPVPFNSTENSRSADTTAIEVENYFLSSFEEFVSHFGVYVTAVVLVSGIFGNLLSTVIFYRLRRRDHVTATYLGPLAVSDLINLCVGVNGWIDNGLYAFSGGTIHMQEAISAEHCKFRIFLFKKSKQKNSNSRYILILIYQRSF